MDRVRTLYQKFVETFPDSNVPWISWAELEKSLGELPRYREILELALQNPNLALPESVWKCYIDNEIELEEYENVRSLYQRLLNLSSDLKVWTSFAQFEASIQEKDKARDILS
jgi:crooked neck